MKDADDLIGKGIELNNSGNFEEAIKYFAKAARLDPGNAFTLFNWGDSLTYLAEIKQDESLFRESCEKYGKAVQIQPNYAEAYNNWGITLFGLAKMIQEESLFRESFAKYDKAIQIQPGIPSVYNNYGTALYYLAQIKQDESLFREASEKYEKAAQILPDDASVFFNWGTMLYVLAKMKQDELLFRESFEKYTIATQIQPDFAFALFNWGIALSTLAKIKQDESLFRESFAKYEKVAQIQLYFAPLFYSWGIALSDLAKMKQDESLFKESFQKFAKATQIKPDYAYAFCFWGTALYYLSQINHEESLVKEATKCFENSRMDILDILVSFDDKSDREYIAQTDILFPILDSDTDDGRFFKETTKNIDESELDNYKKAYISSIFIISQLHVNNEDEKFVATYRDKKVSQKILFDNSKFRLNAINYSNDSTEGKILFDYLYDEGKRLKNESLNREYGAFAGCFIFSHDSLNQFRLYGKEEGKEGTGLSLVFRNGFFNEEAKMATKQIKTEASNTYGKEEKHSLFRCVYIDPETKRVETVGHKEEYLFYRENYKKETDEVIKKKWESYHKYITDIIINIREEMEELKGLVKDLEPAIVGQLLINLRYLTKHIAFKEEQECRIVKIYRLDDERIKTSDDFKQMYIEYEPKVSNHVKGIYFGPKADGMELFQDMLTHKGLTILCEKSKNPLA